ncbi:hypothetical protein FSP39_010962 [Pinctada imbricata]|uniref:glutamine synthetase n=1 Tax=Pinctada imbricata TaxID=66713 RepID=A0AA88Y3U3_PINIB|nr:hypothetical protein FSP39_010962 [Pinctada imbricata]
MGQTPDVGMEREMQELHMKACLYAGVNYAGHIREDGLSQWEYQIGPCKGVEIGDHLLVSRYLLYRVAEMMGVNVTMKPKPIKSYGSGGHLNFSTNKMREQGGIESIIKMYDPTFGAENAERLKESHWSPSMEFHAEIGDKWSSSVRIPSMVSVNGKGYLEDRRPPSNLDPYAASEALVRACILGEFLKQK